MRQRHVITFVAAVVAAAFVSTNAARLADSPVELVGDIVSEGPDRLAELTRGDRTGRHLGFDTYAYPGDDVMQAWKDNGPYEWVGYYLPAPCHKGRTWVGKRETLAQMGWGTAVVYVGQQTWDKTPRGIETTYRTMSKTKYVSKRVKKNVIVDGKRTTRWFTQTVPVKKTIRIPVHVRVDPRERPIEDCNAELVNGVRGKIEAADAIQRAEAEGFPKGTVIFLDIEYMTATPVKMRQYYRAWTAQLLADGRYRPGFYAHDHNAEVIYRDVKAEYTRAGKTEEPPFWIAGGSSFTPDKQPHEVGRDFAAMWQGLINVVEEWSGHTLPIDVNVSHVPDPSAQPKRDTADTTALKENQTADVKADSTAIQLPTPATQPPQRRP